MNRLIFSLALAIGISANAHAQTAAPSVSAASTPAPLKVEAEWGRRAFQRMESGALLRFAISNPSANAMQNVRVTATGEGINFSKVLPVLAAAGRETIEVPVPASRLRAGEYSIRVSAAVAGTPAAETILVYQIANRPIAERLPVFMWGDVTPGLDKYKDLGFTHIFAVWINPKTVWDAGKVIGSDPKVETSMNRVGGLLDDALTRGLELGWNISPGRVIEDQDALVRIERDGKIFEVNKRRSIVGFLPPVQQYFANVGETVAKRYGQFPAWTFANLNTEIRDGAGPSFHPAEIADYKAWSGQNIPAEVVNKWGVRYNTLPNFPANRIIPDDHPILKYYTWYWKRGDGWVMLGDILHDSIKNNLPAKQAQNFLTFTDPALRVASTYGAGGKLDAIEQWTYTNPDPFRVAITADELQRMAQNTASGKPQLPIQMIQLFWYRSQTALGAPSTPATGAVPAAPPAAAPTAPTTHPAGPAPTGEKSNWYDYDPNAQYITVSPHALREAVWSALSRPNAMLAYHGWQALLPSDGTHAYKYTNPATQEEFKRLHRGLVEKLGATLKQVPNRSHDVAYLESFSSQIFAGRGNYGWANKNQGARYRSVLYANLSPDVIYEETVRNENLDKYRVLFLFEADVLPQSVFEKIAAWQKRGGIIVADKFLTPALKADIVLPEIDLVAESNAREKANVQQAANELLAALGTKYSRFTWSDDRETILHARESDGLQYLFAINDKRRAGNYVGQYGRMMEDGVENTTTVNVRRDAKFVYDLANGGLVSAKSHGGVLSINTTLEAAGGRLFALTDQKIGSIQIDAPPTAKAGSTLTVKARLLDAAGKPMRGVWPLQIEILDAQNRAAEYSGWYGAKNGEESVSVPLAQNEANGNWTVRVRDGAGGMVAQKTVRVQ